MDSKNLTAKDIMKRKTPVLSFDTTVPEAMSYFQKEETSFALVQASPDRFQGILTEGNLMRIYLRYRTQPGKDSIILYRNYFETAQLIHEDETYADIMKKLVTSEHNRVFVIDSGSAVVGYISVKDLLPFLPLEGQENTKKTPLAHAEVASELYLYETFFSQSPFLMHSVNREGSIRMANSILHRVLGYPEGELIGLSVFEIYPKDVMDLVRQSLSQIIDERNFKVVKGKMVHKSGRLIDVEMVSRGLLNESGQVIGTVTVTRPLDMAFLLNCMPQI